MSLGIWSDAAGGFIATDLTKEVVDREREFQAACARVALDGFHLDSGHVKLKLAEFEERREDEEDEE